MENPEPVQLLEVKSKREASLLTRNGSSKPETISYWDRIVTDYRYLDLNCLNWYKLKRNAIYLRQDSNLQQLVAEFENRLSILFVIYEQFLII